MTKMRQSSSLSLSHSMTVVVVLVVLTLAQQLSSVSAQSTKHKTKLERFQSLLDSPCRVYLGPSSLSTDDRLKFGLFAGVDFKRNETLLFLSELAIPLIDFLDGPLSFIDEYNDILKGLESALWTGDYAGAAKFEGNYSTTLFIGGVGSLSNYHSAYSNVDWIQASTMLHNLFDKTSDSGSSASVTVKSLFTPGQAHPARGCTTPFENLTMHVTRDVIPAGMELFASFGDVWDDEGNKEIAENDVFEQRIVKKDYAMADQLVDKLVQLLAHPDLGKDADLKEETLDLVLEKILPAAGGKRAKAIRSLIPAASRKLSQVQAVGSFRYRHDDSIKKSSKWLKKNAVCVDTMELGLSTIPNAGRGAFATRNFKVGDRITITPMIPLYEDVLQMFGINSVHPNDNEFYLEFTDDYLGQQILTNYAFGHAQSTLLMIPTAPHVTLINHGGAKSANVEIEWADHDELMQNSELHGKTLQELRDMDPQPHFLMQVVATRKIKKGDEILLNYGQDWEDAYNNYLKMYNEVHSGGADSSWQLKAEDVQRTYLTTPYPVDLKKEAHPYPEGVMTACFLLTDEVEDGTPKTTERGHAVYRWNGPKSYNAYQGHDLVICDLMARTPEDDVSEIRYTVHTRFKGNNDIVQVIGVPHAAIVIVPRPYSSDLHTPGAFRRWIGMRDEIFPQAWRMREQLVQ